MCLGTAGRKGAGWTVEGGRHLMWHGLGWGMDGGILWGERGHMQGLVFQRESAAGGQATP